MNEITEAILTIANPLTLNEQRQRSQSFLDQLLNNPNLEVLALELVTSPIPQVQYFGFSVFEHLLRQPITENLKNSVIQVLKLVGDNVESCPLFIQKKACWIFAELVKRIWPLEWTDMDMILIQLFDNMRTRPLSFYILNSLIEDIFVYGDEIAAKRKTALITALTAITLDPIQLSELQDFQDGRVDVELLIKVCRLHDNNPGWIKRIINSLGGCEEGIIQNALECLKTFLEWIPFKAIVVNNIVGLIHELLKQPKFIPIGLEMWMVLLDRNYPTNAVEFRDEIVWKPWFEQQELLQTLYIIWQNNAGSQDLNISKKVAQLANGLTKHICFKKNKSFVPTRISDLVEFYIDVSRHPALSIQLNGIQAIFELFKHEYVSTIVIRKTNVPKILEEILTHLTVSLDDTATNFYYMEYDSLSEAKNRARFNIALRLDTLKAISKLMPEDCFSWISTHLKHYFTGESNGIGNLLLDSRIKSARFCIGCSNVISDSKRVAEQRKTSI